MAIKLSGNEVITNAYVLSQITGTDAVTANTVNNAIVTQANLLIIYASDGSVAKKIYGATDTPI